MTKHARYHSRTFLSVSVRIALLTWVFVSLTRGYRDLFVSNFKKMFNKAKQNMERWSTLLLSLARRINSVKMSIMPRFLFLFQAIPVFIPKSFFKDLSAYLLIWNKKVP